MSERRDVRPHIHHGRHGFGCLCPPGHTGSRCGTATALSFEGSGFLWVPSGSAPAGDSGCTVALRFQTVQPAALLLFGGDWDAFVMLEVLAGFVHLTLQVSERPKVVLLIPQDTSDGGWHASEATFAAAVTLALGGDACTGAGIASAPSPFERGGSSACALQNAFLGGLPEGSAHSGDAPPHVHEIPSAPSLVGCLQDVQLDSNAITAENISSAASPNVRAGCSRKDRCESQPGHNRGRCLNLRLGHRGLGRELHGQAAPDGDDPAGPCCWLPADRNGGGWGCAPVPSR